MQSHMTHAILNNEAPSPHVYGPVPVSYRSVQADQGPRLAAFIKLSGDASPPSSRRRGRSGTPSWFVRYTSARAGGRKSTSELGRFTRHLDLPFPSLECVSLSPAPSSPAGGTWHGAPTATAASVAFAAGPLPSAAEPGEVACRGPPLAWPGRRLSVNAAFIAAARPSRQLLARICMLPRPSRCTLHCACVYRHRSTSQPQAIDAPVKAGNSQVTMHSNNASPRSNVHDGGGETFTSGDQRLPGLVLGPSVTKNQPGPED